MKESGPVGLEAGPDSGPGAGRRHCQPQQQQREQREQPVRGGGSDSATPTNNNSKGPVDAGTAVVNGNGPTTAAAAAPPGVGNSNNFEYEDSEWDIGIGNLIIDLDADIEKNNGHQQSQHTANSSSSSNHATGSHPDKASSGMPSGGSPSNQASGSPCSGATVPAANSTANASAAKGKMAATAAMQTVTHSTEPAGLKMKIKRTKPGPGTRSTEAKHEIVKSDGSSSPAPASTSASSASTNSSNSVQAANGPRHSSNSSSSGNPGNNTSSANSNNSSNSTAASAKGRNVAAAHKRDKSREKHVASPPVVNNAGVKIPSPAAVSTTSSSASVTCSVTMTTSSGVTVTPVVSSASSVVSSSTSVRLANSGALTVTPVAALPSSGAGGRTPPSGTECRPLSVLPQTIATNGSSPSNSSANYSNSAAPVTVTPVSGTQISPVMIAGLANANGNTPTTSPPNHNSTCPRPEEPPSPPNKKWRGHLPTENKVPMDTSSPVPNSACPSTGRGVMMVAVPSSGSTSGSGMANGTHSSSSPNSLPVTASQPASRSDACVGTCSASTMTEPECLGPCEPGTAVTLEGIVWHETEGGVLVVNVTWRGKTYVGTLLDCTRHDWAPPRFCDSPTSDVESRVPKGRAKRGRGATGTPVPTGAGANALGADPSLSPMHSKLRNGAKGRRGVLPAPPSPAKETGNKRKGGRTAEETNFSSNNSNVSTANSSTQPSSNKRSRSSSRGAGCSSPTSQMEAQSGQTLVSSPMLIECPEPNCSKKYRHINGLKYHQSHAHSSGGGNGSGSNSGDNNFDEDSNPEMPVKKEADESEVAPFTGKVPMPPGPNASVLPAAGLSSTATADGDVASPQKVVASSTSIPRTPTPSPSAAASKMSNPESVISATPSAATASASSSSNVNGQANVPVNAPSAAATAAAGSEHTFTPIQPQPPATGPWVTSLATPGSRMPPGQPASETADSPASGDSGDHRKLGKHKKKSKDRDRDRERERDKDRKKSETNPPGLNGSQTYPPPAGSAATPSSPLVATGEVGPAAPLLSNGSVTNPPAVEQSREDVQSPAYSDISDANDQPPILNDADLSDGLNKKHDKLASVEGLPGNPVAPPGAGHLGSFGMYPFYGQPPYMVPPGAGPTNLSAKELEQRREEGLPPKSAPPMPPSGQHMHPSYQPYGFMPPYSSYPMDPLMVDPSLRPSNKTPPDGSVLSPRGQMHPSRPPMDGLSPGRNSSKPSPLIQDENKPLPVDATKAVPKDLSKAPLDLGMPKSSPAPQPATPTVNPALHPAHQANKSVVDLTVSKDSKDPMDGKAKGPAPGTGPMPDPKGAPGQYDPALLAYQRQQEELRRYYNVFPPEGEGQSIPMGSMYPPVPLNSPGGAPAWPGLLSGTKGSPLPERNKPPQPPHQNPQSTPNSQPPSHQQTGKTMMANSSASSPKLRPPSVESRSKEHDLHRHADQRREKEREKERESSLERNKAASEGVKPTMETHGPPPPPGPPPGSMPGSLAFSYLYPYGLPFDPSHPAYRSMASMMGGPHFGPPGPGHSHPFLGPGHPHLGPQQPPQMPPGMRYPFQGGPPSEAQMLEMLHGQYWSQGGMPPQGPQGPPQQGPPPPNQQQQPQQQNPSQQAAGSHKIHELAERAMKSPPVSPAVGPGGLPSSSQSGGTSSTPSGPKLNDRRSPSGGMGPGMGHRPPGHGGPMPGASPGGPPGHQLPGFLTPLSSQYPPSSVYGGKPLLRP